MSAIVIDGKSIAQGIKNTILTDLSTGMRPTLAILRPNSPASLMYSEAQVRLATSLGIRTEVAHCADDVTEEYVESIIRKWNDDPDIHGIFILQPFVPGINMERMAMLIHPLKDVECIHPFDSSLRHFSKAPSGSCTAMAIMEILDKIGASVAGAEVTVVGHSKIVGQPVATQLLDRHATVTVCHKATADRALLHDHVRHAEILIVAVGKAGCIPGEWVRPNSIVIDVGVNTVDGKIVGDVGFEKACERASHITPVRGGVGPVTAIVGMRQLVMAYKLQRERR